MGKERRTDRIECREVPSFVKRAKKIAESKGIDLSSLCRIAIREYLERHEKQSAA